MLQIFLIAVYNVLWENWKGICVLQAQYGDLTGR